MIHCFNEVKSCQHEDVGVICGVVYRHIVFDGVILSTDDYFVNDQGFYQHDSRFLQQAHMWNQQRGNN